MWRRFQGQSQHHKFYLNSFFEDDFRCGCSFEQAKVEMHILAYDYHWDNHTIWSLPRNERKMWVDMLMQQHKAEHDSINNSASSSSSTYKESF